MRLLFVAGCLEPGRSGVGDYTRLLAAACSRLGHECHLFALNDPWVTKIHEGSFSVAASDWPITRLPAKASSTVKGDILRAKLAELDPEWVSLQFVPYAFEQRGLVWPKLQCVALMLNRRRVHVMFHEIWIGDYAGSPWKERWIGWLQKNMIRGFINNIKPAAIHTSNLIYRNMLEAAGVNTGLLPMFGTIVLSKDTAESWLFPLLQSRGVPITCKSRSAYWLVGFFGSIHTKFSMCKLLLELREAARERGQEVVLLSVGNAGEQGTLLMESGRGTDVNVHSVCLGQQPEEKVSQLLNSLDLGLTSTPLNIIGKSSSVASMLEHGLPVLAVSDESAPQIAGEEASVGVYSQDDFFGAKKYMEPFPRQRHARVDDTARTFLADLHRNSSATVLSSVVPPVVSHGTA